MPRNLGTIPLSEVQGNVFAAYYFIRVDVAAPVGTLRYTDHYAGAFTGNIDGLSQTWAAGDFVLGALNQSTHSVANVSSVSFANLFDGNSAPWTTWAVSPGLRGVKVQVWIAYFDRATSALIDKVKLFEGTIDSGEFGNRANLALAPYLKPWSRQVPAITGLMLGAAPLMPNPSVTIRWADAVGSISGYQSVPNTSGAANGVPVPSTGTGRRPGLR